MDRWPAVAIRNSSRAGCLSNVSTGLLTWIPGLFITYVETTVRIARHQSHTPKEMEHFPSSIAKLRQSSYDSRRCAAFMGERPLYSLLRHNQWLCRIIEFPMVVLCDRWLGG